MNKKILAVDCRASLTVINKLKDLGYDIISIPQKQMFDSAVSSHPDIFITVFNGMVFSDVSIKDLFINIGSVEFLNREAVIGENCYKYPYDIEFNCVLVGRNLICNEKYTNKQILKYAKNNSLRIINVNQGYAKCSVCVVSDNAIITEDVGIANKSIECGIDVLLIEKGHVKLAGYDYGFFGGCSGLIEKNLIVFNGSLEKHPDCERIKCFCKNYNVNTLSLSDDYLYDIGTIMRIV